MRFQKRDHRYGERGLDQASRCGREERSVKGVEVRPGKWCSELMDVLARINFPLRSERRQAMLNQVIQGRLICEVLVRPDDSCRDYQPPV